MVLVTTSIVFLLSVLGKYLADVFLHARIPLSGTFIGLQYTQNRGVAFSITFPGPLQKILIGIALLLVAYAAWHARTRWSQLSFGLILGGALANVADRVRDGMVTDFFQVGNFPVFNIADACITIGVLSLSCEVLVQWWRRR